VVPFRPPKSAGTETTFAEDLMEAETIRTRVGEMAAEAVPWLDRHRLYARTVTLKVRYADFTTVTRSLTVAPTRDLAVIAGAAQALLERTEAGRRPVRLLGVTVKHFADTEVLEPVVPDGRLPFDDRRA